MAITMLFSELNNEYTERVVVKRGRLVSSPAKIMQGITTLLEMHAQYQCEVFYIFQSIIKPFPKRTYKLMNVVRKELKTVLAEKQVRC